MRARIERFAVGETAESPSQSHGSTLCPLAALRPLLLCRFPLFLTVQELILQMFRDSLRK